MIFVQERAFILVGFCRWVRWDSKGCGVDSLHAENDLAQLYRWSEAVIEKVSSEYVELIKVMSLELFDFEI